MRDPRRRPPRVWSALLLTLRSLLWVILFPALVAGYLPWRYFGLRNVRLWPAEPLHLIGMASIAIGAAMLAWCVWDFAHRGRGTLSPVDPPRALVVEGLYRYVRNPMYLGVTLILLGEVALTRSGTLFLYWGVWFLAVNIFVLAYEEPSLRRQFGPGYEDYARRVGRWFPHRRSPPPSA